MFWQHQLLLLLVVLYCATIFSDGNDQFFIKSASPKKIPLLGKRNRNNNVDFEKFFLKASKSVPRIGRTENALQQRSANNGGVDFDNLPYSSSYVYAEHPSVQNRDVKIKYPLWSEIAERFEYDPALFTSPDMLVRLEQELGDDPSVYDWEKVRFKRDLQNVGKDKKQLV